MAQQISTNTFGCAKWVVSSDATQGTHTTIAGALTSASSGDTIFLRPGTYTENITLKAGVNIAAYVCDAFTPNVTIVGTSTMTTAGSVSISGIRLQTNSAALLAVTGTLASIVNLDNCFLNCTNNTGITYSSSSASSAININNCKGDLGTTGIGLFTATSSGTLTIIKSTFSNSGGSSTASSISSGILNTYWCQYTNPITMTSTAAGTWEWCDFMTSAQNATTLNLNGGSIGVKFCNIGSGSASGVSIASSAATMEFCNIASTNTNAITGAGSLSYAGLCFDSTSSTVNVTTQAILPFGANIPSFSAVLSTSSNNRTGNGTVYTLVCDTETYDVMSNYNNGTGTFTAPFTGKYQFEYQLYLTGCTIASSMTINIVTTARTYSNGVFRAAGNQDFRQHLSCIADMTAGDTTTFQVSAFGEAGDTDDILGNNAYSGTWVQGRYLGPK